MDIRSLYKRLVAGLDKIYILNLNQISERYSPAMYEASVKSLSINHVDHNFKVTCDYIYDGHEKFDKSNYFRDDKDFEKLLKHRKYPYVWTDEKSIARKYLKVIIELWRSYD